MRAPSLSVEELLSFNKFSVDEHEAHIVLDAPRCESCTNRPCLYVCAAKCYTHDESSSAVRFDYAGCLECGTCRIACRQLGEAGVKSWNYPVGTFGVAFRHG